MVCVRWEQAWKRLDVSQRPRPQLTFDVLYLHLTEFTKYKKMSQRGTERENEQRTVWNCQKTCRSHTGAGVRLGSTKTRRFCAKTLSKMRKWIVHRKIWTRFVKSFYQNFHIALFKFKIQALDRLRRVFKFTEISFLAEKTPESILLFTHLSCNGK